jgi:uncharacterized protein (DUF2249 family)
VAFDLNVEGLDTCSQHERLLNRFDELQCGERFELVDLTDPQHLFVQLAFARGGQFDWQYLAQGPVQWRVRITRSAIAPVKPFEQTCPCQ